MTSSDSQLSRYLATLACAFVAVTANAQGMADYPQIVEQVGVSVVHILVRSQSTQDSRPFRGSGFILSSDGYIVTAGSVFGAGDQISVVLTDGRTMAARRVGARADVALLKVEATDLRPVKFADALKTKTGQRVLLVGSAYEGMNTAADGIVSHQARSRTGDSGLNVVPAPYVATTVPLQPGNGGAPLFDLAGEVVGMVTGQYVSRNPIYSPISLGVPSDVIQSVTESLKTSDSKVSVPRR